MSTFNLSSARDVAVVLAEAAAVPVSCEGSV